MSKEIFQSNLQFLNESVLNAHANSYLLHMLHVDVEI